MEFQRKVRLILQRTAALVANIGGQHDRRVDILWQRPRKAHLRQPGIVLVVVARFGRQLFAVRGLQRRGERGRACDRGGESQHDILDRVAARLRIDAAACHLGGEGRAHVIVEALVAAGGAVRRTKLRDAGIPDERHFAAGGQRATAFDRDDPVEHRFAIGACCGQPQRQAGIVAELLSPPVAVADAGQDFGGRFARQNVERNLLSDAIDGAIAIAAHRGAIGRDIGGDEEYLVFLDPVIAVARQDRARRRTAGVDLEPVVADDADAARGAQVGAQFDMAADTAGERFGKFQNPGARIDPASGRRHFAVVRRGCLGARIAERHHVFGKAQGETADRAVAVSGAARRSERDLRDGVAASGRKRDRDGHDERESHLAGQPVRQPTPSRHHRVVSPSGPVIILLETGATVQHAPRTGPA